MKPKFEAGENIAIKVPPHQFEQTASFYRDVLGLEQLTLSSYNEYESAPFKFGDKNLWVDTMTTISQAEIWLEIKTDSIEQAARHFEGCHVARRDEIEALPDDFKGFLT